MSLEEFPTTQPEENQTNEPSNIDSSQLEDLGSPSPTEEQFTDDSTPTEPSAQPKKADIQSVYHYVIHNRYEERGYQDAILIPDSSCKSQGIERLVGLLKIKIEAVLDFYNAELKKMEAHIQTRSRAGLPDIVTELESEKAILEEKYNKVLEIKEEANQGEGYFVSTLKLSYSIGFNKGLAALSKDIIKHDD